MRRLALLVVALVAMAGVAAPLQAQTARTVRFDSPALGGSQATFAILLPPGYADSDARYPVVYLLHGGTHNHTAFPARAWFGKEVARRGMIAVMPHTPQSTYMARGGSGSMAVVDFVANDLVTYVDATYRTRATRDSRAIAGLSMGGFGAVITGLTHPELFGHVGAFSGAFTAGREPQIQAAMRTIPETLLPFVYLACGVGDSALAGSRGLAALLADKRIPHELREVPGGHTWEVWDPQTLAFFDVLTRQPAWPKPR